MLTLDFIPPDWNSAEDCARFFSRIEPENCLAYTIRKIEKVFYCLRRGRRYPIFLFETKEDLPNALFPFEGCCYIRIRAEGVPPQTIRLCLAHELGHLVYDFRSGSSHEESLEAEIFSWVFAYNLIKEKSDDYKRRQTYKEFQYSDRELKDSILALTCDEENLHEALEKELQRPQSLPSAQQ